MDPVFTVVYCVHLEVQVCWAELSSGIWTSEFKLPVYRVWTLFVVVSDLMTEQTETDLLSVCVSALDQRSSLWEEAPLWNSTETSSLSWSLHVNITLSLKLRNVTCLNQDVILSLWRCFIYKEKPMWLTSFSEIKREDDKSSNTTEWGLIKGGVCEGERKRKLKWEQIKSGRQRQPGGDKTE